MLWEPTKHVGAIRRNSHVMQCTVGSRGTTKLLHCGILEGTINNKTQNGTVEFGEHCGGP